MSDPEEVKATPRRLSTPAATVLGAVIGAAVTLAVALMTVQSNRDTAQLAVETEHRVDAYEALNDRVKTLQVVGSTVNSALSAGDKDALQDLISAKSDVERAVIGVRTFGSTEAQMAAEVVEREATAFVSDVRNGRDASGNKQHLVDALKEFDSVANRDRC